MGFFSSIGKQLTARKIIFYFLFHGVHVGLFIYGW